MRNPFHRRIIRFLICNGSLGNPVPANPNVRITPAGDTRVTPAGDTRIVE